MHDCFDCLFTFVFQSLGLAIATVIVFFGAAQPAYSFTVHAVATLLQLVIDEPPIDVTALATFDAKHGTPNNG